MDETTQKVYIKLSELGDRERDVLQILSKIQGLKDSPEQLVASVPCYISDAKISRPLADKVKSYLEKAGAIVEFEDETSQADELNIEDMSPAMFERPGYEVPVIEENSDSAVEEDPLIYPDTPPQPPAIKSNSLEPQESLNDNQYAERFVYEAEYIEQDGRRRRPRKKKKRKRVNVFALGIFLVLAVMVGGGIWMYLSGQFSDLSQQYERNPVVGQVGVLEIENPEGAELSLHHVVGTRVVRQLSLEGTKIRLKRGDYYVEGRKGSQIAHFPVYIEGRGHEVKVEVVFPSKQVPSENLAYIPDGWFRMGNKETEVAHFGFPDEKPDIDVYVSGFFLSKYEVTNQEYAKFVEAGGYEKEAYWERLIADWPSLVEQVPSYGRVYGNDGWNSVRKYIHTRFIDSDDNPGPRLWEDDTPPYDYGQDAHPVMGVSLYEAEAYCQWMTQQTGLLHRLPTEAEWEKASRGYEGYFFSYGNEYDPARANTESEGPENVGSYPENSYGLYDMTGNVWEWVSDQYHADTYRQLLDKYHTEIRNPFMFDESRRYDRSIVRGGSFRSVNRINARTPARYPMFPNDWHTNIGFRYVVVP